MYFPRSSANGVCCKNIVDALIQNGDEVTCIVNEDITRTNEEIVDGARVIRVKARLQYRLMEWCDYNRETTVTKLIKVIAGIINKMQLFIMSPWWPRISPFYTRRFYKAAKKLIVQEKYNAIICAYTPIDTLYAGYLLKKEFPQIRYIPYYLDALAGGWGPTIWSKEKIDSRTRGLESRIDEIADFVISMQSSLTYHNAYPLSNSDKINRYFLDVPTFLPKSGEESTISNKKNSGIIRVVYCGSIHFPDRDPRPLLNHFIPICNNHNVELVFIGSSNCPNIFYDYSLKANHKIRTLGQMAHEKAMEYLESADYLINIGSTNPNTVTCKIFEYMQFRKPIISTYKIGNEPSIPYLEKYGCYFLLNENDDCDFEKHNKELSDFIMSKHQINDQDLSQTFYLNTPQAVIDLLNK